MTNMNSVQLNLQYTPMPTSPQQLEEAGYSWDGEEGLNFTSPDNTTITFDEKNNLTYRCSYNDEGLCTSIEFDNNQDGKVDSSIQYSYENTKSKSLFSPLRELFIKDMPSVEAIDYDGDANVDTVMYGNSFLDCETPFWNQKKREINKSIRGFNKCIGVFKNKFFGGIVLPKKEQIKTVQKDIENPEKAQI